MTNLLILSFQDQNISFTQKSIKCMRGDPKRLIFYYAILDYQDEVNNIRILYTLSHACYSGKKKFNLLTSRNFADQ